MAEPAIVVSRIDPMDSHVALLDFLQYTFSLLLSRPEEASIRSEHRENGDLVFTVGLHPEDTGKVIGRNGHTVSAIRSLLEAGAEKAGTRVVLRVDERSDENPDSDPEPGSES